MLPIAIAALSTANLSAAATPASVIAWDDFLFPDHAGGGWIDEWRGETDFFTGELTVNTVGFNLTYPGLNCGGWAVSGVGQTFRSLPATQTTGIIYLSALVTGGGYCNVTLYEDFNEKIGGGVVYNPDINGPHSTFGAWDMTRNYDFAESGGMFVGQGLRASNVPVDQATHLIVMRINLDANTMEGWVDPDLSSPFGTPAFSSKAGTNGGNYHFNRVRLEITDSARLDEVRIVSGDPELIEAQITSPAVSEPSSEGGQSGPTKLGGNVTADGSTPIFERGVVFAPTQINGDPSIGGEGVTTVLTSGTVGRFTVPVAGLNPLTAYTFKAYATNAIGTTYTSAGQFTTPEAHVPVVADAGENFSVNPGQPVTIQGAGSGPANATLSYTWEQLMGGTPVKNLIVTGSQLSFTAPDVPRGGETLSFRLTVSANGETATDLVSVTVTNDNHLPVARAGADQTVAEGATVTLHGDSSFDEDNDPLTYIWTLVSDPSCTLIGKCPQFTAPLVDANGTPTTLEWELLVSDSFAPNPTDKVSAGFNADDVRDRVVITVTNTNNLPVANAGDDQTVDAGTLVTLNGSASTDPDNDALKYTWTKVGAPGVTLSGVSPSFTAPVVTNGTADVEWELTVNDGYGGIAKDRVVIHVQSPNAPPLVTAARPTESVLWPPNHGMVSVGITGVSDPDNNPVTITITSVTQDEPTNGLGDGDTAIDAILNADGTVLLRAERSGKGDGRVYRVSFTATDGKASASGVVKVGVPKNKNTDAAVESAASFDSTR